MRSVALFLLAAMAFSSSPAFAERIVNDSGGRIGTYFARFTRDRDSGERVVVDGQCLSACTLVLGLVPRNRICATSNATFGFHAAWNPNGTGDTVVNPEATRLLWNTYPARIRAWIRHKGGLNRTMIFLRGQDLAALVPPCSPEFEQGDVAARARSPQSGRPRYRHARHAPTGVRPVLASGDAAALSRFDTAPRRRP